MTALKTILLAIYLYGPVFVFGQTSSKDPIDPTIASVRQDTLLTKAWNAFVSAIEKNDLILLENLSTACIHCGWCVTNTKMEASLVMIFRYENENTWYARLNNEYSFIPIKKFINEDLMLILTDTVVDRLQDASKLHFVGNDHNLKVYDNACIVGTIYDLKPDLREVLLTVSDTTPKYEGYQYAFAFINIAGEYKFCGFSTIP